MLTIGLIKEGKQPEDNRVALTPAQCKWIKQNKKDIRVIVQASATRCYGDAEYIKAGVEVLPTVEEADVLFGIKEVPVKDLIANKKYLFFSHTKKKQPHNQKLLQAVLAKNITLIDYESLTHDDGTRIIGFGFFAGIVGAHNGMMAYGNRTGLFNLVSVYKMKSFTELIHTYFGLKLPPIKVAVTGSGRVAHGILEIMNLLEIHEVEPDEFVEKTFSYPVYVHLKGKDLYRHKETGKYNRDDFHENPEHYNCNFIELCPHADILMNGVYWDKNVPRLFEKTDVQNADFKITSIADITDDENGSVPINLGDQTIENPVYGVDRTTLLKTAPYLPNSVDVMAVGNLPNELPRDASRYFGEQLIKYILQPLLYETNTNVINNATITNNGKLTEPFSYLQAYANGEL
jgi:saccharopine dehydrogenase (NAD+, L-lysine forming)